MATLQQKNKSEILTDLYRIDSILYKQNGNHNHVDEIIEKVAEFKNDTLLAYTYLSYSIILNDAKSVIYGFKAADLFKQIKYYRFYIYINLDNARLYRDYYNYADAIKYALRAKDQLNNITNIDSVAFNSIADNTASCIEDEILYELALDNLQFNKLDSASFYIQQLEKKSVARKLGYLKCQTNYLNGAVNLAKNDTAIAQAYFTNCIAYTDSLKSNTLYNNFYYLALTYSFYEKAKIEYKYCKLENAKSLALLADLYASKSPYLIPRIKTAELLSNIYSNLHKTDSVLYYSQLQISYTNEAYNPQLIYGMYEITHSNEIREIEDRKQKDELALQREHNLQFAALAIGVISLLLVFFIFSNSIIVGTKTIEIIGTIALLMVFEFINLFIHPYLAHWLHESPILMFFVLVFIAAIIAPFHHKLEQYTKEKLISKNKKKRLANAKKTLAELEND